MLRSSVLKRSKGPEREEPDQPKDDKFEKMLERAKRKTLLWAIMAASPSFFLAMLIFLNVLSSEIQSALGILLIGINALLIIFGLYQVSLTLLDAYSYKLYIRLVKAHAAEQTVAVESPIRSAPKPAPTYAPTPPLAAAPPTRQATAVRPVQAVQTPYERSTPLVSATPLAPRGQTVSSAVSAPPPPRCPSCGRELPYGDLHLICPFCGTRLK